MRTLPIIACSASVNYLVVVRIMRPQKKREFKNMHAVDHLILRMSKPTKLITAFIWK
jgi:hypothetical protein